MSAFGIRVRAQRWSRLPEQAEGKRTAAIPLLWFLPGADRMRGGAARHFASDMDSHRGIQAEATCRAIFGKATHYQMLAESRPWRAGFFCGIQGSQFVEATAPEASQRKPPFGKLLNPHMISD